jgi:hypothetical protein
VFVCVHQGPHHTARAGAGTRRPGLDSSRARNADCRIRADEFPARRLTARGRPQIDIPSRVLEDPRKSLQ